MKDGNNGLQKTETQSMQGSDLTMQVEPISCRQWLIGMALQGLVSSNFYDRYSLRSSSQQPIVQVAASIAVEYADAIIERLNKEDKQ